MAPRFFILMCSFSLALSARATPQYQQRHAASTDPTIVQTTSGLVQGHLASWPEDNNVVEFLGIPYAQAPVDDLRFAAPKALENTSSNTIIASKFSVDCMQFPGNAGLSPGASSQLQALGFGMGGGSLEAPHAYGEDCLTVNVWSKASGAPRSSSSSSSSRAVLVWIHGGGFAKGTSNAPFYSGSRLAQDEDVVVVSFNYRLNIFGFPGAPGIPDQNVGLLDQRLAVEWVRDNIAGFGGDPDRITMFGESSGAVSVDLYAFAWTRDPIVNGFIAQSGSASVPSAPVNETSWFTVSSELGCGGADAGAATVPCMRTKSATDIVNVLGQASAGSIGASFVPAVDEKVVFSDVQARSASGNFVKKPLLIGTNDFELGLARALPSSLSFGGTGLNANASDEWLRAASEIAFGCGAAAAAEDRVANGVPAWRYRYMAVWDNTALTNTTGAYHSSEIPLALGTNPLRPNSAVDTEEEARLTCAMVHAWAEFAKDPTGGLARLGWPLYNSTGNTLIKLGDQNQSALSVGPSAQFDSICSTYF